MDLKVYPKKDYRKIEGLTDTQLLEAMGLYTNKVKTEIIKQLEIENGINFDLIEDNGEMLSYFHQAIDLAMTKGMELAVDRWKLTEYYEQVSSNKINPIDIYEFKENKGVSGILFADGTFKKCGNAQHHLIVQEIPFEEQVKCLFFSCQMFGNGDGLVTHSPVGFKGIVKQQRDWIKSHFKYLDQNQKNTVCTDYNCADFIVGDI